jgi:hypothetical protein
MHDSVETPTEDFLREQFSDIGDAVAAFRRHTTGLVAAGYVETTHTRHTRRHLSAHPEIKLEWQKGLDDLMLAAPRGTRQHQGGARAALSVAGRAPHLRRRRR